MLAGAGVAAFEQGALPHALTGVRSVPIVRGLTPVGILSFTDVLRAVAS